MTTTYIPSESGLDRATFQLASLDDYYVFTDDFTVAELDADYVDAFSDVTIVIHLDDADFDCDNCCDRDFATLADNTRALLPVYNAHDNSIVHLDELPAATQLYINSILDR